MFKPIALLAASLCLVQISTASAADYKVTLASSTFYTILGSAPAPEELAWGEFIYSAPSIASPWNALKEFSLNIGEHHFGLADVAYRNDVASVLIGANINYMQNIAPWTDDFIAHFNPSANGLTLYYSSSDAYGTWQSFTSKVTLTDMAVSPVPEPATYLMLLAGLGLMSAALRCRKK